MKQNILLIILFLPAIFSTVCYSQDRVLNIWSDEIPGAIKNPTYSEDTITLENGARRIRRVTVPTISVYFPAKEKSNRMAVLIFPGGGYERLAIDKAEKDIAYKLNDFGITAIVVKYRLPNDSIMTDKSTGPLQDAQEALRLVRRNARAWGISENQIGVMGLSAGGHVASTLATHFNSEVYKSNNTSARPDFCVLLYPVITMDTVFAHKGSRLRLIGKEPSPEKIKCFSNEQQVIKETPPTFIVHASDDKSVPVQNSIMYYESLRKYNIPAELHIYEKGGHGFTLNVKGTASNWIEDCKNWLMEINERLK